MYLNFAWRERQLFVHNSFERWIGEIWSNRESFVLDFLSSKSLTSSCVVITKRPVKSITSTGGDRPFPFRNITNSEINMSPLTIKYQTKFITQSIKGFSLTYNSTFVTFYPYKLFPKFIFTSIEKHSALYLNQTTKLNQSKTNI